MVTAQALRMMNAKFDVAGGTRPLRPVLGPSTEERASAYAQLKALLIYYRFLPGQQLRVADLAKRLSTSTTPVREALNRLHAEGFLVLQPHRGFFAKALSLHEMTDLYEFGYALLKYAVEKAIRAPERAVTLSLHALAEDVAGIARRDELDPHFCATGIERVLEKLVSFTANDVMLAEFRNFHERTHYVRVLLLQQPKQIPKRLRDLQMLVTTVKARELEAALAVLDKHWKWKLEALPELVKDAISRYYR